MGNLNRQSNFESLKIMAMLMIVSHHFIAKNFFNIDTAIVGLTASKLFLQFIGNQAFIGNNLFFMCSAWFLVNETVDVDGFPKKQIKHIWAIEKRMLFYSVTFWIFFRILCVGGTANISLLAKSLFPMSANLWWYPTTYAVFLLVQPFYQKGLKALEKTELQKLILTMVCVWSASTVIPFFNYGSSNFLCFIMLYAIVFLMSKYEIEWMTGGNCRLAIIVGYIIALASIAVLDILGSKISVAGQYSCYFIRGNYRFLPMVISVAIFALSVNWKIKSKIINYIASLTFGVYLIHMYPLMTECLFSKQGALFDMSRYASNSLFILCTIGEILVCFAGCLLIEASRKVLVDLLGRILKVKAQRKTRK